MHYKGGFACPDEEKSKEELIEELNKLRHCVESGDTPVERSLTFIGETTRRLLEESFDAVFINVEGKIAYINDIGARLLGAKSPKELIGRPISQIVHPDYHRLVKERIHRMCKENIAVPTHDEKFVRLDGSVMDVEAMAIKVYYGGKPAIRVAFRDISERKQTEQEMAEYRTIVHFSGDAIVGLTPEGIVTSWNPAAEKIFGYTAEEMIGHMPFAIIPPDTRREFEDLINKVRQGGQVSQYDTIRVRKDGSRICVSVTAAPIKGPDGHVVGISWTGRDITKRKKTEMALEEAKAQAELYLDLISHDINNMNQVGLGYLEIALEKLRLKPEDRVLIEKPLEALRNSSALISNVRKIRSVARHELAYEPVDVCKVLSEIRSEFLKAPGKEVTITLSPACECTVQANALLKDVFSNLVDNAIKHSMGPVTVDIKTSLVQEKGKRYCRIGVEDNGPGIPDELKKKLFTRFRRGTTKAQGMGLGLYIVKMLVGDLHGRVWVEDRVPGDHTKGARFVVLLPAVEK